MEEVTVADQSAGEVDVLSCTRRLGFFTRAGKGTQKRSIRRAIAIFHKTKKTSRRLKIRLKMFPRPKKPRKNEDEEAEDVPREKIQRRIDKLTAARKSAEEKATALAAEAEEARAKVAEYEAQLNEAARPVLSPTADNPLADVDTQDALDAKIKSAQEVRRWALRNTDGATVKRPDGTEVYLDSDQVKDYLIKSTMSKHPRTCPPAMARPTPAGA
jgi:hypothetical protein